MNNTMKNVNAVELINVLNLEAAIVENETSAKVIISMLNEFSIKFSNAIIKLNESATRKFITGAIDITSENECIELFEATQAAFWNIGEEREIKRAKSM